MNKTIVANWKMNGLLQESMLRIKELRQHALNRSPSCDVVVCPPFTLLRDIAEKTPGTSIKIGGQDCHESEHGAYTGNISAQMLKDMTCTHVILGHSERRTHHNEPSELIRQKAEAAHQAGLIAIICVGETLYEHEHGLTKEMVKQQLDLSIPDTATKDNTIIAYEPVWAIGSGKTPSKEEIENTHTHIINQLHDTKGDTFSVLYGGSVSDKNAKDIVHYQGVGGLLVGKASLDSEKFWNIIQTTDNA